MAVGQRRFIKSAKLIGSARQCDAMPVLGSHVSNAKLYGLSKLYRDVFFWLDSDKLKESRNAAERARLVGINSNVIYTELDPKEYDDVFISEKIR